MTEKNRKGGNEMAAVKIEFNGEEFRVPGISKREEEAYYTDSRDDAIGTARIIHGEKADIRIIRRKERD